MPVVWMNHMKKMLQDLVAPFVNTKDSGSPGTTESDTLAAGLRSSEDLQDFQDTWANVQDDFPDTQTGALQS